MKRVTWQDIVSKSNYRELERVNRNGGVMLFAEGERNGKKSILWAFGRNENKLEIARPMEFHDWFGDKGIHRPVTREIMMINARDDAFGWLEERDARR